MQTIKIFGLPRSCTNVTEVIIKHNFKVRILTNYPDWKHGPNTHKGRSVHDDQRSIHTDDLKFVICTKNPYHWLWSLHTFENQSKRQHKTEIEFLKGTAWHYEKNPITMHNELITHWLTMYDDPSILQQAKHEDILKNQKALLKRLEKAFGLERRRHELEPIKKRINPGAKITDSQFDKKQMGFNSPSVNYIKRNLDKKALKLSGYL